MEELEIKSTPFNKAELKRIIDLIPQTDPRSREYAQLLECIERYIYFANVIAAAQEFIEKDELPVPQVVPEIVQFNPPVAEDEKFEAPDDQSHSIAQKAEEMMREKVAEYDAATVKKALQDARMAGKIGSAKDWIRENFGADGFQALPAKHYGAVMAKLKELG